MLFPAANQTEGHPHVRTTDKLGRWGDARARTATADRRVLTRARKLFAGLSQGLDGEIDRLRAAMDIETDEKRIKALTELIRMNQKALQAVLETEAKLMSEAPKARPGRDVIDLAEARAEIARRLDRLAG